MESYPIIGLANAVLFVVLAIYALKKPISSFLSSRSRWLKRRKEDAIRSLADAEEIYNRHERDLKHISENMERLMDQAGREGENEGEKILIQAEKAADRIIERSLARADSVISRKNRDFFYNMVDRSVKEAEKQIKNTITLDTQTLLGKSFLRRLKQMEVSSGDDSYK